MKRWGWLIHTLLAICCFSKNSRAQTCVDDYFSIEYETRTVQNPVTVTLTTEKDLLLAGSALRYRSVLTDAWLTKFSPQGTLLWSRNYTSTDFNCVQFKKAVPDGDGYIIVGNIGNVDTTVVPPATITQQGFLMKVDKYGNKLWTKMFGKNRVAEKVTDINSIIPTAGGDFIITVNYSAAQNSSNIILRIDGEGNIKWTSSIYSSADPVYFGPLRISQLRNGQLVLANTIFGRNGEGYYTACIDYESGSPQWQRSFVHPALSTREKTFGEVVQITDLPNGDLSFITSFADTAYIYFRKTKKVINFITDGVGRLKKVMAYHNPPPLYASAAVADATTGEQTILMDNADAPFLMKLDAAGNVQWQKAYPVIGRSQETRTLLSTEHGNYFFSFTHDGGSKFLKLVKTDLLGNADCVEAPYNIITEDISAQFRAENANLTFDNGMAVWHGVSSLFVGKYTMQGTYICRNVCCRDVIDTADNIDLCNVTSYTLPNNDIIRGPGTYGVTYKTSRGCDSIVYYNISFSQKPIVSLGDDLCLGNEDSVLLTTRGGYANYHWMNGESSDSFYIARQPGLYKVSVSNACGTATDTVEVFRDCDFGIHMPNAFTPNADTFNDDFGIPKLNKNKLTSLQIYNRYGQQVFQTTDRNKRWDGTMNGKQAVEGIYIYVVIMKTLDGKTITQKGIVSLIR